MQRGVDARGVRSLCGGRDDGRPQSARAPGTLQAHGQDVRREIDLRAAGIRHLLPHERRGADDVQRQARRRRVPEAQARDRVHEHPAELLRGVQRWGLCAVGPASLAERPESAANSPLARLTLESRPG